MIGYTTLGTNDMGQATAFYDRLFKAIGAERVFDKETFVAWGRSKQSPAFGVIKPFDEQTATVGNGVMIALPLASRESVDAIHAKALALGATNEGDPGVRQQLL
ncbi:VOC family protein [Alkalimarinus sediminis]|uniref:VOC family protein n=1 Tax=Alkalimarinus sediminis TaxID=1632866 RepID=A0A9E8KPC8_9ALTE|nr:VOC family protein [Alkalimarinus sediminis]UZW74614.1 VOC family protein [Alkalimarinus sediminis]